MHEWISRFGALVSTRDKARTKKWIEFPGGTDRRLVPVDAGRQALTRPRAARPPFDLRGHALVRRGRRRSDRAGAPEAGDDGVVEVPAARRPDRRQPEWRGQDDRLGVLRAAEARRTRVDPSPLGRGGRAA